MTFTVSFPWRDFSLNYLKNGLQRHDIKYVCVQFGGMSCLYLGNAPFALILISTVHMSSYLPPFSISLFLSHISLRVLTVTVDLIYTTVTTGSY